MSARASVTSRPMDELATRPLQPNLGVEVMGVDLSKPQSDAMIESIRASWDKHLLLLFRDQNLTEEQQIAFSERLGALVLQTERDKRSTRNPAILRISNVGEDGKLDLSTQRFFAILTGLWHTDGSYKPVPSYGSILHCLQVPDRGGETCFANTIAAYEALSASVKGEIEHKHMVHSYEFTRLFAPGIKPLTEEQCSEVPPVSHPVVRTHPDGRRSIYISGNVGYYISGMPLEQGKTLHSKLIDWATRDEFVYCHKWRPGDVLMWINRGTMHRILPYDAQSPRVMQRTELAGSEIPV
jgi:alpha-ketoglutarate-dependent taurine dioxygenase